MKRSTEDAKAERDEMELDSQIMRDVNTHLGYVQWRMRDVPAIYHDMMPCTCNAKKLLEAEQAIRRQFEADMRLGLSPWQEMGPRPEMLDFTEMNADDQVTLGFSAMIFMGMPAMVKPGINPATGKPNAEHPDVLAAQANADRTVEAHAHREFKELEKAAREASARFVQADNAGVTGDELATIERAYNDALDAMKAAQAECDRLRHDRIAACRIHDSHLVSDEAKPATTSGEKREKLL